MVLTPLTAFRSGPSSNTVCMLLNAGTVGSLPRLIPLRNLTLGPKLVVVGLNWPHMDPQMPAKHAFKW